MVKSEKPQSRSARLGLTLPVSRVQGKLKANSSAKRVGAGASVYLTALLECVVEEVLANAAHAVTQQKRKKIAVSDVLDAVRGDREINQLFGRVSVLVGESVVKLDRAAKKAAAARAK